MKHTLTSTTMAFSLSWYIVNRDRLNLSPSYQRPSVWTQEQKVLLIESMLSGIPIPSIIASKSETFLIENIIDGKQRLEAIYDFLDGKYKVYGREYSEFDKIEVRKFENTSLPLIYCHLNSDEKAEEKYYNIFNYSGTAHDQKISASRVEVIDSQGRQYTKYGVKSVEIQMQDEGRTCKVFVENN